MNAVKTIIPDWLDTFSLVIWGLLMVGTLLVVACILWGEVRSKE